MAVRLTTLVHLFLVLLLISPSAWAQRISTVAGSGQAGPIETDEPAAEANFDRPTALGMVYRSVFVADRFRVRSVYPPNVHSIIGTGEQGYSGDGGPPAQARIGEAGGIAFRAGGDTFGVVYFTDPAANRIRVMDNSNALHTFAGDGTASDSGDGGMAVDARFDAPNALALHGRDLYVGTRHRIRRIRTGPEVYTRPTGTVSTYAGTGSPGFSGDGGLARQAQLNGVGALAVGPSGELYVADTGNHRIRRIGTDGIITTVAGNGSVGAGGLGGPAIEAPMSGVTGLAVDASGRLYIAQGQFHRVLRIDSQGRVHLFAGTGTAGFSGDGGPASQARLNWPADIAIDADGRLWISDRDNLRIRLVEATAPDGATVPAAPPAPTADSAFEAARLTVQPPDDGGSPILGYVFEVSPAHAPAQESVYESHGFDGLQNGQEYTFTVRARNAVGLGPPSPPSNTVIPLADLPALSMPAVQVVEGNSGSKQAMLVFQLDKPATVPVTFSVESRGGTATAGMDYVAVPRTGLRIDIGQSSTTLPVTVVGDTTHENDEHFELAWDFGISGAYRAGSSLEPWRVDILDDDARPAGFAVRDDRLVVRENAPGAAVPVLDNDEIDRSRLAGGSLVVVQAPTLGTAIVDDRGTPGTVADDRVEFIPAVDTAGEDLFSYRLCAADGECQEGVVTVSIRPRLPFNPETVSASGFRDVPLQGLRAIGSATYEATPLVAPVTITEMLAADPTTQTPWDSPVGRRVVVRRLPELAGASGREWKILVEAGDATGPVIDLYLGLDLDGDGLASENEVRCVSATAADIERCELDLLQAPGERPAYWAMAHNRGIPEAAVRIDLYEVPMVPGDGSLVATGPGRIPAGEAFDVRISWNQPTLLQGDYRVGYVRMSAGPGQDMGSFPVRLLRKGTSDEAILLRSGVGTALSLRPGASHDAVVIDVPLGATRLTVTTASEQNVDLTLTPWVRGSAQDPASPEVMDVPFAPLYAAYTPGGNESLVVQGGALKPGRWYVVPRNPTAARADIVLTATVEANTPAVRHGSYFNPDRSGHGLFLYPAGNQWAGLWYTYREDGSPTWYYLQAAAPGIDGLWSSPIYRAAWNGSRNALTEIGRATVTPMGGDDFVFSFTLDGRTGSEPMQALGRGCPTLGGAPIDASGHWFNPASAGSGYSVQLFPNYEFFAAFIYDSRGQPRFVAAERSAFGGANADLLAEQLRGFCPTCPRTTAPERFDVGVLGRTLSQGQLQSVSLAVVFGDGVSGAWTADEDIQLLGGPGSTQGCAP